MEDYSMRLSVASLLTLICGAILSVILIAASLVPATRASAQTVSVYVNGRQIQFDQPPVERDGHVFVPLRGVFENMHATVVYTNGSIDATAANGAMVHLAIGSHDTMVNGKPVTLYYAPFLVGGRTLVPLRFIAESLGAV